MVRSRQIFFLASLLLAPALTACVSSGEPMSARLSGNIDAEGSIDAMGGDQANADAASLGGRITNINATSGSDEPSGRFDADAQQAESKGEYRRAERLYKEALVIAESNKGSNHPHVAKIRMALANLYYEQDKLTQAEQFYRHAIQILHDAYGEHDHRYASALNNLAAVLYLQERYSDADALYNRALKIFRSKLGPNHPYVGQTLTNLGKLYHARYKNLGARPTTRPSNDAKAHQAVSRISDAPPSAPKPVVSDGEESPKPAAAAIRRCI